MARCGCGSSLCACVIQAGDDSTRVEGTGSATNPYKIYATFAELTVADSSTIDMTITGDGSEGAPYVLSATVKTTMVSQVFTANGTWNKPEVCGGIRV